MKSDTNNPNERKKLIAAIVLGVVAIVVLWWAFIGFGGSSTPTTTRREAARSATSGQTIVAGTNAKGPTPSEIKDDPLSQMEPIVFTQSVISVPDAKRNIFSYYEPPPPAKNLGTPTPTATPTPPVFVASVSPTNVYARTADFTLEVTGDKFSPEVRIYVDGRELPTKFKSAQQLTTVVPAAVIANPGQRQVIVRSPDGRLYSNTGLGFSVTPPPIPNYSYIGLLGDKHYTRDIALLQDRSNKELLNVQRGDVLSGRFRVTSISEKELVLTDTNLKIKHSLAMATDTGVGLGPLARPTPKVDAEDDEPQ